VDAGLGFGFVAGSKAMETAIKKAKKYKMGSVGIMGPGHMVALVVLVPGRKEQHDRLTICRGGGTASPPMEALRTIGSQPTLLLYTRRPNYKPVILDMATTGVAMGHLQVMESEDRRRLRLASKA